MPLYTFYHCKLDGSAASFDTVDLPDDVSARRRALAALDEHLSCAFVTVWSGEKKVAERHRLGAAPTGGARPTAQKSAEPAP
jgi:hypothetical protein